MLSDIAIQLEERGVPEDVYRDMAVQDALRVINEDAIQLVRVNGKWVATRPVQVKSSSRAYKVTVQVK